MRATELLQEMIVKHKSEDSNWVIAFKDGIWLMDDETESVEALEIWDTIFKSIGEQIDTNDFEDIYSIIEHIKESRPDVIVAQINMDNKEIHYDMISSVQHPITSKLFKKVVKQLGINVVNGMSLYGDEEDTTAFYPENMRGGLPDTVYHGTTIDVLLKVLKKGLVPQDSGNWEDQNIHTPDVIFFAVDAALPEFHATRRAESINGIPVIIEFKIPDENKVVPDYDVASELYGTGDESLLGSVYQHTDFKETGWKLDRLERWKETLGKVHKRPEKLFGEFGVFGYKGRIPPSHLIRIYTPFTEEFKEVDNDDWFTIKPKDFYEAYEIYESFGMFEEEFLDMEYKDIHFEVYGEYPEEDE